jgi:nucleotide-binding universal stress UspA family protein
VPVLVVPPRAVPADWSAAPSPLVALALDGSELAERALPAAVELARQLGARLALARVVEPLYSRYGYVESLSPYGLDEPDPADDVALARAYLESIAEHVRGEGVATRVVVEYGVPGPTLLETAQRLGALGIVMATHGRGGFARVVLGSVATGLLKQSTLPLLLVHPTPGARPEEVGAALEEATGRS